MNLPKNIGMKNLHNDWLSFSVQVKEALDAELGHKLGYEKNDTADKETANRRNDHSSKTVRSEYGDVEPMFVNIVVVFP